MKTSKRFNEKYFNKFSEKPVEIKAFDKSQYDLGIKFVGYLNKLLESIDVKATLRGSTLFKISGKGDIEVGIYLRDDNWFSTLVFLINEFKSIGNLDIDYARFNVQYEDEEIEIVLQKGEDALRDQKLNDFLLNNPEELKKYEEIKKKFAYNKRIYQTEKNKFFSSIIESL